MNGTAMKNDNFIHEYDDAPALGMCCFDYGKMEGSLEALCAALCQYCAVP
jgi:hypothetical protein